MTAFLVAALVSLGIGAPLYLFCRSGLKHVGNQEGLAAVPLAWVILTLAGAMPLALWEGSVDGRGIGLTDAYFETMSGFTTTGATIITEIPDLPHGLLFWRSFTHWLGGMGIVMLWVAILPALGPGSYQLFRAEVPGLTAERITPRIAETAKILWGIYVGISVAEVLLLWVGPMDLFEALCHTFGTLATGGFSTLNASIGGYDSWYVDLVIIVFMFLAGCNFALYYLLLIGRKREVFQNFEIRFYAGVLVTCTLLVTVVLLAKGLRPLDTAGLSAEQAQEARAHHAAEKEKISTPGRALRTAAFQVVSITTTTGYCTADFDLWPESLRFLFVVLMFFGGCAGSTGGGLKQIRIILVAKMAFRELRRAIQPSAVFHVKVGRRTIEESILLSVMGLFAASIILLAIFTLAMASMGLDFETALTSVVATMFNIGPGLGGVGAVQNYASIPDAGKWLLSFSMLLGRLEFVCVLVLFQPLLYRK